MQNLITGGVPSEVDSEIPIALWRRFEKNELGGFAPKFEALGHLFSIYVRTSEQTFSRQIPVTGQILKAFGITIVIIGIVMLALVYTACRKGPGISVVSPLVALFGDSVALITAAVCATGVVDALWVHFVGGQSLLGWMPDFTASSSVTAAHMASLTGMTFGLPIFTFFITSLTSQRICVDTAGITACGIFGDTHLPWEKLEVVHVRRQRNILLSASGDHRSLQRVLELKAQDQCIIVNQPSSWTRKERILSELSTYVPDNLRQRLAECEERW